MPTLLLKLTALRKGDGTRLEEVLRAMPGVFAVVVSEAECCAEIDFEDDEVAVDRIVERARDAGFDARPSG